MKIKKAIIPAAGLGTRFLPATKAVPKELLPIVDIPTIQLIIQEVVDSGLETVVLVTSREKESIVNHFDVFTALQEKLEKENKFELAEKVKYTSSMVQIVTVRQGTPKGLGHAVLCAKDIIGNEPFAVLLGDDLVDSKTPCLKQLIDNYDKNEKSVVALMEVEEKNISKFGICGGKDITSNSLELNSMVEKPNLEDAPSNLAIVGRYILTPRIFELLEQTQAGVGGEIQLTDAMRSLMLEQGFMGCKFEGQRFDAGDKFGFIKANIHYALKRDNLREPLLNYFKTLI